MRLIIILSVILFFSNCKKDCKKQWSIKGRFLNGTTNVPYKNVTFKAELYNLNANSKTRDNIVVGHAKTDDSGYFEIFYECQSKKRDYIAISAYSSFDWWIRESFPFNKHTNGIYYVSTLGKANIYLNEKIPINNDTLFIALNTHDEFGKNYWKYVDTLIPPLPKVWRTTIGNVKFYNHIYWSRNSSDFKKNLEYIATPRTNYFSFKYKGDPFINEYTIEY